MINGSIYYLPQIQIFPALFILLSCCQSPEHLLTLYRAGACVNAMSYTPITTQGEEVGALRSHKFLGVHLNNKLDCSGKSDAVYNRRLSRLLHEEAQVTQCVCNRLWAVHACVPEVCIMAGDVNRLSEVNENVSKPTFITSCSCWLIRIMPHPSAFIRNLSGFCYVLFAVCTLLTPLLIYAHFTH